MIAHDRRVSAGSYPWVCIGLLSAVWLLNYLDRQVIFSVFPLLQSELKATPVDLGLISAAFLWVYAVMGPLAGYLADRAGRKIMIVLSVAVWSIVTWATGLAHNLTQLLIARALMGFSEACYLPAGLGLIAAWHSEKTRAKATGLHYSGGYLGMVIGGGLGGWMAARYGWRMMFLILGLVGLIYSVVLSVFLRERGNDTAQPKSNDTLIAAISKLFRIPGYKPMFFVFAVLSIANWITYTWLPLYLHERFRLTLANAGFTATFYLQAGSFAGTFVGGAIADSWVQSNGKARLMIQAFGLLAAAPFLFLSGLTSSLPVLIIGMAIFGLGRGIYDANCMPALCQIAPPQLRSTGFGLFNFIGPFAGGAFAAVAGAMKETIGIGGGLQAAAILLASSAVLLFRVKPLRSE